MQTKRLLIRGKLQETQYLLPGPWKIIYFPYTPGILCRDFPGNLEFFFSLYSGNFTCRDFQEIWNFSFPRTPGILHAEISRKSGIFVLRFCLPSLYPGKLLQFSKLRSVRWKKRNTESNACSCKAAVTVTRKVI